MVIGNGLIGSVLKRDFANREGICIFASGVSNSNTTDYAEYSREYELLIKHINTKPECKLVYFSSTSIFSGRVSQYIEHKLSLEKLIALKANNYLILRLPIVVGASNNKNQLIPFLVDKIDKQEEITIFKDCERYLIDSYDLPEIVQNFIHPRFNKSIINIQPDNSILVENLVYRLTELRQVPVPKLKYQDTNPSLKVENTLFKEYLQSRECRVNTNIDTILSKYYKV